MSGQSVTRNQTRPSARAVFWIAFALVMTLAAVLSSRSIAAYQTYFGMYHDDGIYLVTAKSLAEGQGLRILSLPGEPLQTKYPPGYPVLLAAMWLTNPQFPNNLLLLSAVQVVLSIGASVAAVFYLLATRKVTGALALVILAATVLNSHYLDFAPMLMTDLPATLFVMLALWRAEVECKRPFSTLRAALLGVLIAVAPLIRSHALIVIPSVFIFLAARRKLALAAVSAATAAILAGAPLVWQYCHQQPPASFYAYYTNYIGHGFGTLPSASESLDRLWSNYNWSAVLQINTYFPFLQRIQFQGLDPLAFALVYRVGYFFLALPLVIGSLRELRHLSLPGIYALFYALVLASWPIKAEWRHILPELVFNYYFYFRGFRLIASVVKPGFQSHRTAYSMVCAAAAVCFSLYLVVGTTIEAIERAGNYGRSLARVSGWLAPDIQRSDYSEATEWITNRTDSRAIFVCNNDPLLFLNTGRRAVFPSRMEVWRFASGNLVDAGTLLEAIRLSEASYLMVEPMYRTLGAGAKQTAIAASVLARRHPGLLKEVFCSSHGLVRIFAVDRRRLPPVDDMR
jgi:hypothetical protein